MNFPNFKDPEELAEIIQLILGVLAVLCLGAGWVIAIDAFPQYGHCCDDGGGSYSTPSGFVMILSIILFPVFMIGGIITLGFTGGFLQALIMLAIIGSWIAVTFYRMELRDRREKERVKRGDAERKHRSE